MSPIKQRNFRLDYNHIEPLVNIRETEKEIILEAEMTGLAKEDIELELTGNELTIKGKSKQDSESIPKGYTIVHRERIPVEYQRTFLLSDDIDTNKIQAQYENGILRVTLAKSDKVFPKKIEVKD